MEKSSEAKYFAAVFICDLLVTKRQRVMNGFEKRIGETPDYFRKIILEGKEISTSDRVERKRIEDSLIADLFLKIVRGELKPSDEEVQRLAIPLLKLHLTDNFCFRNNLKQELGNLVKYYNQLGYGINFEKAKTFLKEILHELVDELYR